MPAQVDRCGYSYSDLIEFQAVHLDAWAKKIRPEFMSPIREYILSNNCPAPTPAEKHRVWRGQDIIEVIYHWPRIAPAFPPIASEDVI